MEGGEYARPFFFLKQVFSCVFLGCLYFFCRLLCFFCKYNRNSHFGTRVVVVPGWCWDFGCQSLDFCDLCEARDFCAELAVAPRGRTYSRFRPTTLDRAHHHRVRTFYRVRDALDHHRGGAKSAFSTRCDGGVQHQP